MPSYSFYPYLPNRSCLTFVIADFAGDAEALGHARLVLLEHVSASSVAVWAGDRRVGLVGASTAAPAGGVSRSPSDARGRNVSPASRIRLPTRRSKTCPSVN